MLACEISILMYNIAGGAEENDEIENEMIISRLRSLWK
jgi:hypothetical protein